MRFYLSAVNKSVEGNRNAKKVWLIMSKNIAHGFEKSWAMFEKTTGNVFQNHEQCFSKLRAVFFEDMSHTL